MSKDPNLPIAAPSPARRLLPPALIALTASLLPLSSEAQTITPPDDNASGPALAVYSGSIGGAAPTYKGTLRNNHFDYWLNRSRTWILSFNGEFGSWAEITNNGSTIGAGKRWLLSHPGSLYVLSVPMLPGYTDPNTHIGVRAADTEYGGTVSLAKGANGNYDHHFEAVAQNIVNAGIADRTLVRLGWEFNGNWYPWAAYVDTANFPVFFARIVKVMKDIDANNGTTGAGATGDSLRFVWCGARFETSYAVANVYPADIPASTVFPVHDAYPGDIYVDYVGLDLYDASVFYDDITTFPITQAQSNKAWNDSHNANYSNKNGIPYWKAISQARGKPLCFPEWALSNTEAAGRADGGRDNQYFIQSMFNYIQNPANNVAFHVYYDDPSGGTSNGRISNQPGEGNTLHPIASRKFQELWGLPMPNKQSVGTVPSGVAATGISITGGGNGYLSGATATSDSFYFTSRITPPAASGPTLDMFQVKIESVSVAGGQAGVMVRQKNTGDDNSPANGLYAAVFLRNGQCVFQSRTSGGGAAAENGSVAVAAPTPAAPVWLKLARSGNSISGYYSTNGLDWSYVGGQTVDFSGSTKIGVAVGSASATATNVVVHDNLDDANLLTNIASATAPVPANAIIKDDADASGISFTGTWGSNNARTDRHGATYRAAGVASPGTFTFAPSLPAAGLYTVYMRWPADGGFSYNIPVSVVFNGGTAPMTINQEGGRYQWNYLGTFPFAATGGSVSITSSSAGGGTHTMADAVMFVPLPGPSLPAPKTSTDVGSPALAGSASYSGGIFTVNGAGAAIGGTADEFHYVSQTMSGSQTLIARVTGLANTNSDAKAGIMFRNGTGAGDSFMMISTSQGGTIKLGWRSSSGGTATISSGVSSGSAPSALTPKWLKIVKNGNSFTCFYANGTAVPTAWTAVGGAISFSMSSTFRAGLVVNSKNTGAVAAATFDNVTP